ncbi:hypothetical protein LWI28_013340 [Acer negundo]|uniref:Uncharacterized protein n=1 Tax=Acer negundo TaxID=4023 RepID=A0AAD5IU02_ACENE|nr:hypothetical protein LWI28_013340 [Acer negundo]
MERGESVESRTGDELFWLSMRKMVSSPTSPPQSFVGDWQPIRQRIQRSCSSNKEFVATAKLRRQRRRGHPSSPSVFFQHPPLSDAAIHNRFGFQCIWLEVFRVFNPNIASPPPQSFVGDWQPIRQRFHRSSSNNNEFVATAKLRHRRRRGHPSSSSILLFPTQPYATDLGSNVFSWRRAFKNL